MNRTQKLTFFCAILLALALLAGIAGLPQAVRNGVIAGALAPAFILSAALLGTVIHLRREGCARPAHFVDRAARAALLALDPKEFAVREAADELFLAALRAVGQASEGHAGRSEWANAALALSEDVRRTGVPVDARYLVARASAGDLLWLSRRLNGVLPTDGEHQEDQFLPPMQEVVDEEVLEA